MEFLNSGLLWGILGILIPIIVHFWHHKKAKVYSWAAMHFLVEKSKQQSRGIQFDNFWMMVLRILCLLILVFYLTQPSFQKKGIQHWVYPDAQVVDNFKFEIEQALKNKEEVFWFNGEEYGTSIPSEKSNWEGLVHSTHKKVLYLPRTFSEIPPQKVPVSNEISFRIVASEPQKIERNLKLEPSVIRIKNTLKSDEITAALKAIEKVYSIQFEEVSENYDVWLSDKETDKCIFLSPLQVKTLGQQGRLPEFLMEKLVGGPSKLQLSETQVKAIFEQVKRKQPTENKSSQSIIMAVLFVLIGVERWLSFRRKL